MPDDEWIDAGDAMIRYSISQATVRQWRRRYGVRVRRWRGRMLYHAGDLAEVEAHTRTRGRGVARGRAVVQAAKAVAWLGESHTDAPRSKRSYVTMNADSYAHRTPRGGHGA